jgi:hypothetical protein
MWKTKQFKRSWTEKMISGSKDIRMILQFTFWIEAIDALTLAKLTRKSWISTQKRALRIIMMGKELLRRC